MIGTAKIQSQIRQLQQYDIAATNFKTKLNQIPGDCSICNHNTYNNGANGNNNGRIDEIATGNVPPTYLYPEPIFFFRDMVTMETLKGTNVQGPSGLYDIAPGRGILPAEIGRGGVSVIGNARGEIYYVFLQNSTVTNDHQYSSRMAQGNFTPAEALAIDSKLDDGLPDIGNVAAVSATVAANSTALPFQLDSTTNCRTSATQYNMASTAANPCRLVIKSNFK